MTDTRKYSHVPWVVLGIYLILTGTGYLSSYSEPGILWFIIIHIEYAFSHILFGILCIINGVFLWRNRPPLDSLIIQTLTFWVIVGSIWNSIEFEFYDFDTFFSQDQFIWILVITQSYLEKRNLKESISLNFKNLFQVDFKRILLIVVFYIIIKIPSMYLTYDDFQWIP